MNSPQWKKLYFKNLPVAPLGIIALPGSRELAALIDQRLVEHRKSFVRANPDFGSVPGLLKDTFIIASDCPRFETGEGKAVLFETVRGYDIYIVADIGNYNCKFRMYGSECPMSPDDHFQDLKRVITAIGGRTRRITVIMPLLYEGRQHRRQSRESLDCAVALQELERMGVDNIFTFDAHDPRVQNAVPLIGFNNLHPTYQIIRSMVEHEPELEIARGKMLVVSPDEGAMSRSIYYASILGLDVSMFYKRRDYTRIVNGKNPIIQHEYLGENVEGKDVLIVDDLLSSGDSILDIARELKKRKARKIFAAVTFALFVEGVAKFRDCYREGIISRVFATNLTYQREELRREPWLVSVDMSEFTSYLIDLLNHDQSTSALFDPSHKIGEFLRSARRN